MSAETILKIIAKATSGPGFLANSIITATLSVGTELASLVNTGLAASLKELKEDGLRRSKARVQGEEAEARVKVAEAVEAENKATLAKRNAGVARAEEMQKLAAAAKTDAEAKATLIKAEADQMAARAAAKAKLIEAIAALHRKGGCVAFDSDALQKLVGGDLERSPFVAGSIIRKANKIVSAGEATDIDLVVMPLATNEKPDIVPATPSQGPAQPKPRKQRSRKKPK